MNSGKVDRAYAQVSESRPDVWHVVTAKWSMNVGIGALGSANAQQWVKLLNEAHLDGIREGAASATITQLRKRLERLGLSKKNKTAY